VAIPEKEGLLMAGVEDRGEYNGGGPMPNTVFPKGNDALTPSDKLRLQSITGQEEDSRAPVDPYFWQGGTLEKMDDYKRQAIADSRARESAEQARSRAEVDRYKETQY